MDSSIHNGDEYLTCWKAVWWDFGHFGQTWALNIEDECEAVVVLALFEYKYGKKV